ncbi:MAG TPA: aldo/keto reductase [Armatimonadota bacterium]|nr:aldo/keto reductase [Armatimonadota bacterium]
MGIILAEPVGSRTYYLLLVKSIGGMMNYRRLGDSGLKVSEISLGNWLTSGDKLDEQASHAIFDRAWELGINFFDTADIYAKGRAEEILGTWLKTKPREQVVVATKCRGRMWDGPNGEGLSKKHILEAAEASLRRLGLDYIDLYQFHWPDNDTPIEESLEAMAILMEQGKVLYAGCSNFDTEELRDALEVADELGLPRFISTQPRYNMFQRGIEATLMPRCAKEGIGIIVWSPLEQGLLTEKYLTGTAPAGSRLYGHEEGQSWLNPANLKALNELAEIAHSKNAKLSQLALAWILSHPEITSCIVGASKVEQIEENAQAADLDLSDDELQQIEAILQEREKTCP